MAELLPPNTTQQTGIEREIRSEPKPENRGHDTLFRKRDAQPISVTLIKIDTAIANYLRDKIKPVIIDNNKQLVVPVLYANAERWKQIRKDGVLRDNSTRVQTPLVMFRRSSVARSAYTSPVNRYLERNYATGWNRHNSYDKFAVLNQITPSRKLISVKLPDYISIAYDFLIWTDYIEQMNDIIEQVN